MTNKLSTYSIAGFISLVLFGILTGCQKEEFDAPEIHENSVTGVIAKDGDFSLFISALDKAELVQPLNDAGPFTIFAPNNAALQAGGISTTTIDTVKGFIGKTYLMDILTYHMLGDKSIQSIGDNDSAKTNFATLNGKQFFVSQSSKGIMINAVSTTITKQALNGITYGISKVLTIPSKSLYETISADSRFTILVKAIITSGLVSDLGKGDIGYGLFAPTDPDFIANGITIAYIDDEVSKYNFYESIINNANKEIAQLKADSTASYNDASAVSIIVAKMDVEKAKIANAQPKFNAAKANLDALKATVLYHLTPRVYFSSNLNTGDVRTLLGKAKTIKLNSGTSVTVNDGKGTTATVTEADIITTNGVIHIIDKVLKP